MNPIKPTPGIEAGYADLMPAAWPFCHSDMEVHGYDITYDDSNESY